LSSPTFSYYDQYSSVKDSYYSLILAMAGFVILAGAAILRFSGLVPLYLTYLTIVAAAIIFVDAYFVYKGSHAAKSMGILLGIIAMIVSSNPAHFSALARFGSSPALSGADITMVLGFYLLPAVYIISYVLETISSREGLRQ
jgi:hypothetical protein